MFTLNQMQRKIVDAPIGSRHSIFVHGKAGAGKTTALQHRLLRLIESGIPVRRILILLFDRSQSRSWQDATFDEESTTYVPLNVMTYFGLARRMVLDLWSQIGPATEFVSLEKAPLYIGYGESQVLMNKVIAPQLELGDFDGLRLRSQQIISQLLDNLGRAASNGISLDEMEKRLIHTWSGEEERTRYFLHAAHAARQFRSSCFKWGLMDSSLVVHLFTQHVLHHDSFKQYIGDHFDHLLVDNVDEFDPAAAQAVNQLMNLIESTTIAYDDGGGYRRLLAVAPDHSWQLHKRCVETVKLETSYTGSPPLFALGRMVRHRVTHVEQESYDDAYKAVGGLIETDSRGQAAREAVATISELDGNSIAILAPYLDASLMHIIAGALDENNISFEVLRRRSRPKDEPMVRAWLTLAALTHPNWQVKVHTIDVAEALEIPIPNLDRPRALLASRKLYDRSSGKLKQISDDDSNLIDRLGQKHVDNLKKFIDWIPSLPEDDSIDLTLRRLFHKWGRGYEMRPGPEQARAQHRAAVCNWLIRASTRYLEAAQRMEFESANSLNRSFIEAIHMGMVTGDPVPEAETFGDEPRVIVAPAHSFLLSGKVTDYQVWMDVRSIGWWETPRQPLSNAYVLGASWDPEEKWTEAHDLRKRNEALAQLIDGLVTRCRKGIFVATSKRDRRGSHQEGALLRALRPVVSRLADVE